MANEGKCHCGNGVWTREAGGGVRDACTRCGCYFKMPRACDDKADPTSWRIARYEADIARYMGNDKAYADAGLSEDHPLRQLEIKRAKVARVLLERLRERGRHT